MWEGTSVYSCVSDAGVDVSISILRSSGGSLPGSGVFCVSRSISGVSVAVNKSVWRRWAGGSTENRYASAGAKVGDRRRSASSSTTKRQRSRPHSCAAPDVSRSTSRPGVATMICGRCSPSSFACFVISMPPKTKAHFRPMRLPWPTARNCSCSCTPSSRVGVNMTA